MEKRGSERPNKKGGEFEEKYSQGVVSQDTYVVAVVLMKNNLNQKKNKQNNKKTAQNKT